MAIDSILDGARFPQDEVQICMRQDLEVERQDLERKLLLLKSGGGNDDRLGGKAPADLSALQEQLNELTKTMQENSLTFHMEGVSSEEYNSLQRRAGKPRTGDRQDEQIGFNLSNFYKMLVKRCTTKVTSPDGDEAKFDEDQWEKFFKVINDAQYDFVVETARKLNRQAARTPTVGQI